MELIKDYDVDIQYHPVKANIVADALSRKRIENLASLITSERHIIDDMRKLEFKDSTYFDL